MKILVTGGAGFIGSHLAERLIEEKHKVVVIDNLGTGREEFVNSIKNHPNFEFVEGTVLDRRLLNEAMDGCDAVFHLAAILGVKNTVENPLEIIEDNIDMTRNVLELAFARKAKVIFASTSEVYGKNEELPFSEDSSRVLGPTSKHRWSYATAKALDEHLCFGYAEKGLPITIVRYFNAYGPRANNSQYGGVVPKFIHSALNNEPITVYGDGNQTRCFTYVEDTVQGTLQCLDRKHDNQCYNIGSNDQISINNLAEKIKSMTNSQSIIKHISYEQAYGDGYEDMRNRIPDITKSAKNLSFRPNIPLDSGLLKTIEWYKSHGSEQ